MTDTPSHTPGLWRARDLGAGTIDIASEKGLCLATCYGEPERAVRLANAHLMAAAPDMLAALQGVLAWADARKSELVPFGPGGAAMRAVRDAIAKATGA